MPNEVSKAIFLKALKLLDAKLGDANERVTFLCVGGGALMLSLGMRESTEDLDGVLQPSDPDTALLFARLATQVGRELGIGDIWINTQVKSIMAGQRFAPSYFEERAQYIGLHLKVLFAKPGYLLMMKSQSFGEARKISRTSYVSFGYSTYEPWILCVKPSKSLVAPGTSSATVNMSYWACVLRGLSQMQHLMTLCG